MHSWHT